MKNGNFNMSHCKALTMLVLVAAGSSARAEVLLDTISPGTWQNHPNWGMPMSFNQSTQAAVGISFTGNGAALSRFGMVVSLWAGSVQEPSPAAGDLSLRFNILSSVSAFTSADWGQVPGVLPHQVAVSNSGCTTPIGSFGGVNYYYLEVDLAPLSLAPGLGQQVVLGAAFGNGNFGNPYTPVAQGALGGPFGGDSYIFNQLGYFGSSQGFLAQYGFPPVGGPVAGVTNIAAYISTVPPLGACPGDLNNDGSRNTLDLTAFLGAFGTTTAPSTNGPDFDNNGQVNTADLVTFLGVFGVPCPS